MSSRSHVSSRSPTPRHQSDGRVSSRAPGRARSRGSSRSRGSCRSGARRHDINRMAEFQSLANRSAGWNEGIASIRVNSPPTIPGRGRCDSVSSGGLEGRDASSRGAVRACPVASLGTYHEPRSYPGHPSHLSADTTIPDRIWAHGRQGIVRRALWAMCPGKGVEYREGRRIQGRASNSRDPDQE